MIKLLIVSLLLYRVVGAPKLLVVRQRIVISWLKSAPLWMHKMFLLLYKVVCASAKLAVGKRIVIICRLESALLWLHEMLRPTELLWLHEMFLLLMWNVQLAPGSHHTSSSCPRTLRDLLGNIELIVIPQAIFIFASESISSRESLLLMLLIGNVHPTP